MNAKSADSVLVIGAGVVGLCAALRLQRQGWSVTVVDPLLGDAASYGNAGHIATEQVEPQANWARVRSAPRNLFAFGGAIDVRDPLTTLPWLARLMGAARPQRFAQGRRALANMLGHALCDWQALVNELGCSELLSSSGHDVLRESQRSAQAGKAAWQCTDIGTTQLRDLTGSELDGYGALLDRRPIAGLHFSGSGQIRDLGAVMLALRRALEADGGRILRGKVRTVAAEQGIGHAICENGDILRADTLLIAAGIGSAAIMANLGPRPPLIAERGYHLHWPQHSWPAEALPVVFEDRSMIVTRFSNGLRAAGFVEFAQTQTAPDPRKWQALRQHVQALGIGVEGPGCAWFGARPTLPDYLPAIGRSTVASNVLYAFGHQHLGLTLAPVTAHIVSALALGDDPKLPIEAFDLKRFHTSSGASKA